MIKKILKTINLINLTFFLTVAQAQTEKPLVDLGIINSEKVYQVTDVDIRTLFVLPNHEKEINHWLSDLPPQQFPVSKSTQTTFFSPTYILDKDIFDHQKNLLYKKGTRVNPLLIVKPTVEYLFIDGKKIPQIHFAIEFTKNKPNVKVLLLSGNYLKIKKILPNLYYAYPYITKAFEIKYSMAHLSYNPSLSTSQMTIIYYPLPEKSQ